jgi:hypothetical protein
MLVFTGRAGFPCHDRFALTPTATGLNYAQASFTRDFQSESPLTATILITTGFDLQLTVGLGESDLSETANTQNREQSRA